MDFLENYIILNLKVKNVYKFTLLLSYKVNVSSAATPKTHALNNLIRYWYREQFPCRCPFVESKRVESLHWRWQLNVVDGDSACISVTNQSRMRIDLFQRSHLRTTASNVLGTVLSYCSRSAGPWFMDGLARPNEVIPGRKPNEIRLIEIF